MRDFKEKYDDFMAGNLMQRCGIEYVNKIFDIASKGLTPIVAITLIILYYYIILSTLGVMCDTVFDEFTTASCQHEYSTLYIHTTCNVDTLLSY